MQYSIEHNPFDRVLPTKFYSRSFTSICRGKVDNIACTVQNSNMVVYISSERSVLLTMQDRLSISAWNIGFRPSASEFWDDMSADDSNADREKDIVV